MTGRRAAVRVGRWSLPWRPRTAATALAVLASTVVLACVSLAIGDMNISVGRVAAVLVGGGDGGDRFIVLDLRLPRLVVTVLVGLALGLSGAVVQNITRNPLASPDVIGILSGASAGAVAAIVLGTSSTLLIPSMAMAGGLTAAAVVFLASWKGGVEGYRIVLVGIGVAAICSALTSLLLVRARVHEAAQAVVWLTGTLDGRTWTHAVPLMIVVGLVVPVLLVLLHALGALSLGDATAGSIGVRVDSVRVVALVAATLLASVAAAATGPIAFVAFVAPQVMMRVIGSPTPPIMGSGLGGAFLLLSTDVIARTLLPVELPVGIVTVVIGAPFFLFLLMARRRRLTV
ncbi:iron chelate uptake ABC transporter family permease subunit [Aeromicrobium sp. YIM 150415]|uniref:FecCD family ABC transporter permease n=1 Tax=Aeromicrobium sp. YIM 150415 TaxID=2803912 RepID=UPI0019638055|nr:iron chelate uptake ABC transporter family permease subunit [Aeromicrobium sp. YIM 150415]MBM9465153.1 iron chelate uptake ABC transporter family permease subunit [Aeromicrobium sp. YIM 150415]